MGSEAELYALRAEDEFLLAEKDMLISTDAKVKAELGIPLGKTFFYSVISHAYYSIFYCAKAYLFSKGIKTAPPEEHKKTFDAFKKFVNIGVIDSELLRIYEDAVIKADVLLDIFRLEKKKRGRFTYNLKSEANIPYAKESIENARKFVSNVKALL